MINSTTRLDGADPKWLLILRGISNVLAIILMLFLIIGTIGLYQKSQEIGDIFEDSSTEEPVYEDEPVEEFVPEPGEGQTEESLDWYQTNEDGSESYCYTIPDPYAEICEPTGN